MSTSSPARSMASRLTDWRYLKALAKETYAEIKSDDATGLAAEIAYHAIFAIPPFLIFLVALAALINQITTIPILDNLQTVIDRSAPGQTQPLLDALVEDAIAEVSGGLASLGVIVALLVALWSGSNGIRTLMKAFNRAYDVEEERPFLRKTIMSIGLTILVGLLINVAFVLFVFGGTIGHVIAEWFRLGAAFDIAWNLLRWPLAIVFVMFLLAVLYHFGPNVEQSFHWVSPGAVVATILWIIVTLGFRVYLLLSDPGSAYGAAGSIVVLLFFLYLVGIVLMLGAEINAVLGQRYDPKLVHDLDTHPQKISDPDKRAQAQDQAQSLEQPEVRPEASRGNQSGWRRRREPG